MSPRIAVQCVFLRAGRLLVFEAASPATGERFVRGVGGGVEPGESLEGALAREVREELGREIAEPRLLGAFEHRFTWRRPAHDLVHVFDARFADEAAYALDVVEGIDSDGFVIRASWRTLQDIERSGSPLVPPGLAECLRSRDASRRRP